MCNRYGYLAPITRLVDEFSEIRIPLLFKDGAIPNLEPREHIRPTNIAPIIRPLVADAPGEGVEWVEARWWLIPFFHKGSVRDWRAMCTNARADSVATKPVFREPFKRRRCLVPATHYFEWTGERGAKTMWRFTRTDIDVFCFAGLWDVAHTTEGRIQSFTIITTEAGPDSAPYHDRQPVILDQSQWGPWLDLSADPSALLQPGEAGTVQVARAEV